MKIMKVIRLILSCSKWSYASSLFATNEGTVTLLCHATPKTLPSDMKPRT
jgi:hypothetical protein